MTIVRKDFEIELSESEVNTLVRTQNMLRNLNSQIKESLSEKERESETYSDIKNHIDKIIIDIENLFIIPEIISE